MSNHIKYLYVHIPFCRTKCPYCDFFSATDTSQKTKDLYTKALISEFNNISKELSLSLKSIYLGGGSPLILGIDNLNLLLRTIQDHRSNKTELTIELNPEHLEDKALRSAVIGLFKENGVNRVSIGVQTIDENIKKLISRKFDLNNLLDLIDIFKKENFALSLDFMFGLPTQKLEQLKKDLEFIDSVRPHHISMYLFTPPERYALTKLTPNEDVIETMFSLVHDTLTKLGYIHYEISNYAFKDHESVHNSAYWERESYMGLGAGAHSFYRNKNIRSWHPKDVSLYIQNPKGTETETINKEMEYTETIMLGLRMLNKGVPISFLKGEKFKELLNNGLIIKKDNNILVPTKNIPVLDAIITDLVCP